MVAPTYIIVFLNLFWLASADSCPEPTIEGIQMRRITPDSKYLHPSYLNKKIWISKDHNFCKSAGLEAAVIETFDDYWHIRRDLIEAKNMYYGQEYVYISLGARNWGSGKKHVFHSVNNNKRLPIDLFMFWSTSGPIDDALTLWCHSSLRVCSFYVTFGTDDATPLCQYRKGTPCYDDTPAAKKERKEEEVKLVNLGSTGTRKYYGSTKQKTWKDALDFCEEEGYTLLDFEEDDEEETADLYDYIGEKYTEKIPIPEYASFSWVAARYNGSYSREAKFKWEASGDQWSYKDGSRHWRWLTDSYYNQYPSQRCLAVIRDTKEKKFAARLMECDALSLFVCYEDQSGGGSGSGSTESGSEEEEYSGESSEDESGSDEDGRDGRQEEVEGDEEKGKEGTTKRPKKGKGKKKGDEVVATTKKPKKGKGESKKVEGEVEVTTKKPNKEKAKKKKEEDGDEGGKMTTKKPKKGKEKKEGKTKKPKKGKGKKKEGVTTENPEVDGKLTTENPEGVTTEISAELTTINPEVGTTGNPEVGTTGNPEVGTTGNPEEV